MQQPDPNNNVNIVKPVALNRLSLRSFITHPQDLDQSQKVLYSNLTKELVGQYSTEQLLKDELVAEYNLIVQELTASGELSPNYPIWNILGF